MRVTRFAVLLSIFVAIAVIALLVALPGPGIDHGRVDRHTGNLLPEPVSVVEQALRTGNAASARRILASLPDPQRTDPEVVQALAVLDEEIAIAPRPPAKAAASDSRELLEAIMRIAADAAVAAEIESMFAGIEPRMIPDLEPVDATAARLLHRLHAGANVAESQLLELVAAFDRAGRSRARDRWLRRTMARFPNSVPVRLAMARAFVREGRLLEAAAVTERLAPPAELSSEFWELRADLGRWLGRYADESVALTELLRDEFDEVRARRLIDVHRAARRFDLAARVTLVVSEHTGRRADLEAAADAALAAGLADEGRKALAALVKSAADPAPWLRRLAAIELQDLAFDRAGVHLEALVQRSRDTKDEQALEALYRRRQLREPLADLLLRRWSSATPPAGSPAEALQLLVAEGRREQAQQLLAHLATVDLTPAQFALLLPWWIDAKIEGLEARAIDLAARISPAELAAVTAAFAADPRFAGALAILARRFPADDEVFDARVDQSWLLTDSAAALAAASVLVDERPGSLPALRALAAHAAKVGDAREELRALEAIFALEPADRDAAIRRAWALTAVSAHGAAATAWEGLLAAGYEPARRPFLDSLLRAGRTDEVAARIVEWRDLGSETLLAIGDSLEAAGYSASARAAYARVLANDADHPIALLAMGLSLSWANDPAGSLPFLRRRFETSAEDRAKVGYHLAEALWALQRRGEALPHYERVLADYAERAAADDDAGTMVARSLHRVGRVAEAQAAYRRLLTRQPRNQSLHLDLAELLVETGDTARAAASIAVAAALGPDSRRLLRTKAQCELAAGDPRGARQTLLRSMTLHGRGSGELADLSTAHEQLGDFSAALDTYRRWSALLGGRDSRSGQQRMQDELATVLGAQGFLRAIGDDTSWETAFYGKVHVAERTLVQARVGHGDYRGRSQAVGAGGVDVETTTPLLDLAVVHRHGTARDQIGAGVRVHPDAPGSDVGVWLEGYWDQPLSPWALFVRGGVDELWNEPAAAAGLEGRRTGATLAAYRELGERGWLSTEVRYERVQVKAPGQQRVDDGRATADLQLGWRWTDGDIAIADSFRGHRAPAGPESPYIGDGPLQGGDLHLATWVGFTADHILDNAAVTNVLPVSETVHFVFGAARADRRLTKGLGISVDGLVGTDLRSGGAAWEAAGALTWRPSYGMEWSGRAGVGDAFGRGNFDGSAVFVRLDGTLRW